MTIETYPITHRYYSYKFIIISSPISRIYFLDLLGVVGLGALGVTNKIQIFNPSGSRIYMIYEISTHLHSRPLLLYNEE